MAKAGALRTAQTVAEGYKECVSHRFGSSEAIGRDREPGLMSDFFRAFNSMVGQRLRETMAFLPQANGTTERMVQILIRSIKLYVSDVGQRHWDEYTEWLTFAINTSQDRVRKDTPLYFVPGRNVRFTFESKLPVVNVRRGESGPHRWGYHL